MHPFLYLMIATFLGVLGTLFYGIFNIGRRSVEMTEEKADFSNTLMKLRVFLGFCLLAEIVFYAKFIK